MKSSVLFGLAILCGIVGCGATTDSGDDASNGAAEDSESGAAESSGESGADSEVGEDEPAGDTVEDDNGSTDTDAPADECAEWIAEAPACPALGTEQRWAQMNVEDLGYSPGSGPTVDEVLACTVVSVVADPTQTIIELTCPDPVSLVVRSETELELAIAPDSEVELTVAAAPTDEGHDVRTGWALHDEDGLIVGGMLASSDLPLDLSPLSVTAATLDCYDAALDDGVCTMLPGTTTVTLGDETLELMSGTSGTLGGYLVSAAADATGCGCYGNHEGGINLNLLIVRQ